MSPILVILLAAFPLLFIANWWFVLFLISIFSGWRTLAHRYFSPRAFAGTLHPCAFARMRKARYKGVLNVGADRSGLYLIPIRIFRPCHRPLLIPWSRIQAHPLESGPLAGCRLAFTSHPGTTLDLYGPVVDAIAHYLAPTP